MEVNRNYQSPNFGMALRIKKGAKEALQDCSMETIKQLQEAGEKLKDTKFYHVVVNDDLSAEVKAPKDAYFGFFGKPFGDNFEGDYFAVRNGVSKNKGQMVKDDRIIMIERDRDKVTPFTEAGVARYLPEGSPEPDFNVWNLFGPCTNVQDINTLSKVAKILDDVAVKRYEEGIKTAEELAAKKANVNKAVGNLLDLYGE